MKAGRNSCSRRSQAVAMALTLAIALGPLAMANNPETSGKAESSTAVKSASDAKSETVKESTPSSDAASAKAAETDVSGSTDQANGLKAIVTGDVAGGSSAKSESEKKEALLSEEAQHESGIFHWNLSKRYSKDGDLDLEQTELDLAVMDWPDMKVAHRDLCLLSLWRWNFLRSIAEFMMTVGLGEAVPLTDEESSRLMQDAMTKHYKKGLSYARHQDWSKTIGELELAVNLVPDDFAVQRALAFAYASAGRWDKAEEHYKATFDLSPHDGSSRADLAYFLAQNGKVGEAQKEMEEAVKSQPKAAAYHVDLSWMAETRGDLDTASKELGEAVKLAPQKADLWAHLGRVMEKKGEKDQAESAYAKALEIDPNLVDVKQSLSKLKGENSGEESSVSHPVET